MNTANAPAREAGRDLVAWCLGGVLILTALIYLRSLGGEFPPDLRRSIADNPYLKEWSFLWKSLVNDEWWFIDPARAPISTNYRPIPNLWLWLNYRMFGASPPGWRAGVLAIHLLNVWLVFRVASILAADRWTALLAAAWFALSPLNAEAVVASLSTPICAAFELGALEYYLRNAQAALDDRQPARRRLSIGLFAGALFSYEGSITFPALIAAHAFLLGSHRIDKSHRSHSWGLRAAFFAAWPYVAATLAYLAVRLCIFGTIARPIPQSHYVTAWQAVLTIPGAVWTYFTLLPMPWRAGPAHRFDFAGGATSPFFYLPVIELGAVSLAGILLLKRHPHRRLYLFCAAWFPIALAPMLNFNGISTLDPIHDRYLYFASIGFCVMAADLAAGFARSRAIGAEAAAAAGAVAAIGLGAMLYSAQHYWRDDIALYSQMIRIFPETPAWRRKLAGVLKAQGDLASARTQLKAAVRLAPKAPDLLNDLALLDEEMGDRRGAARAMAERIKLLAHPTPADYSKLAFAADAAGDAAGSEAALNRAEALAGGAAAAALARAQISFLHGEHNRAEAAVREILKRNPKDERALSTLGAMLLSDRRYDDALKPLRVVAALAPGNLNLRYRIALALHGLGRDDEARGECAAVLAAAPGDHNARALMDAIGGGAPNAGR
ncbi:MAG: tetratricopeptide repeat protein [Candidatus Binataceae bacterium]